MKARRSSRVHYDKKQCPWCFRFIGTNNTSVHRNTCKKRPAEEDFAKEMGSLRARMNLGRP
jgi:hypothetical protein